MNKEKFIASGRVVKKNAIKVGVVLCVFFTVIGIISSVKWVRAGGLEPVQKVDVSDIVRVFVDEEGDVVFEHQIVVESATALKDIKSGKIYLSLKGYLTDPKDLGNHE